MNTRILIAALLAASGTAQAGQRYDDTIMRARVVSSMPVYDTINEPSKECWIETVGYETRGYRDGNNTGGAILGAIAGGLIGSTVGKGDGKVAAAAVGAATGAVVGDRWNDGGRYYESRPVQVQRCRNLDHYRQVVTGYDVRYRFNGREFTTRLPYDPGEYLNVSYSIAQDPRGRGWKQGHNDRWAY